MQTVLSMYLLAQYQRPLSFSFLLFLIPGFPKDYLCYILGLGHLSAIGFLIIASVGRLLGTVLETLGGDFIRHEQYQRLFILVGAGLFIVFIVMVFRSQIERVLRTMHIIEYKKKKSKRNKGKLHKQHGGSSEQ